MAGRKAFPCHRLESVSVGLGYYHALPTVRPYSQIDLLVEAVGLERFCYT